MFWAFNLVFFLDSTDILFCSSYQDVNTWEFEEVVKAYHSNAYLAQSSHNSKPLSFYKTKCIDNTDGGDGSDSDGSGSDGTDTDGTGTNDGGDGTGSDGGDTSSDGGTYLKWLIQVQVELIIEQFDVLLFLCNVLNSYTINICMQLNI